MKKLLLALTVVGTLIFCGCGKKKTTKQTTTDKITTKQTTTKIITTKEEETPVVEVVNDGNFKYEYYTTSHSKTEVRYYRLDETSPYINYSKRYVRYDDQNRELEIINYGYDSTSKTVSPNSRYTNNYEDDGKLITFSYYSYDEDKDEWLTCTMNEKTITKVDGKDRVTLEIISRKKSNGYFDFETKYEYDYDDEGRITKRTVSEYNMSYTWALWNKSEYTYEKIGDDYVKTEINSHYYPDGWVISDKEVFYFKDEIQNSDDYYYDEYYNCEDGVYTLENTWKYEYDSNGKEIACYDFEYLDGLFSEGEKLETIYDENGRRICEIEYKAEEVEKDGVKVIEYTPYEKETMFTDMIGYSVHDAYYDWDSTIEDWVKR